MTATVKLIAPAREGDAADPLRAALASALDAKRKAEAAVAAHRQAIARGRQFVEDGEHAVTVAEQAVEKARERHAEALERAAGAGGPAPMSGAVRAARAQLLEAQDEVESARAALEQLTGPRLADLEENIKRRRGDVLIARANLLQPIVEKLLDEGRAAKARLNEIKQILPLLVQGEPELGFTNSIEGLRLSNRLFNRPLEKEIGDLLASNVFLGGPNIERWRSFREALLSDAEVLPPAEGAAPPENAA